MTWKCSSDEPVRIGFPTLAAANMPEPSFEGIMGCVFSRCPAFASMHRFILLAVEQCYLPGFQEPAGRATGIRESESVWEKVSGLLATLVLWKPQNMTYEHPHLCMRHALRVEEQLHFSLFWALLDCYGAGRVVGAWWLWCGPTIEIN